MPLIFSVMDVYEVWPGPNSGVGGEYASFVRGTSDMCLDLSHSGFYGVISGLGFLTRAKYVVRGFVFRSVKIP